LALSAAWFKSACYHIDPSFVVNTYDGKLAALLIFSSHYGLNRCTARHQ